MVIQLEMEKYSMNDDFWRKFGIEIDQMEQAAFFYDLMKTDKEYEEAGLSRDALVI